MDAHPKTTTDSDLTAGDRSPPDQQPPTEPMANDLLKSRYLLGPELGRGGFAITYLAADLQVASRKVVVKILNEARSRDSWSLKKFRSEMEALARIDHTNVVSIIDFGQREDGKPFLVMQYLAGRTLRKIIPRQGLPLAQIAHIIKQTGRALTAAHEVGVCHRDLKPENIMIQADTDGEDQIKLIDFGVATVQQSDLSSSQSSSRAGTHAYMAPEQFEGRSSPASDIYQMGVLAYELVTGIVPFRASTPGGLALQKLERVKVLPKNLRPDLPEAAEEIILKALSVKPGDRFQRARDFGDALAAALVSGELEPVRWTKSDSHWRPVIHSRYRSLWIGALALAVAIGCVAAVYYFTRGSLGKSDSVAILPFQNQTGDPQLAYLSDGITESLINDLSRIPTLRVSARASVLRYRAANVDVEAAGHELHVRRIITGSVSREGNTFAVYAEMIDVRSGMRLWGNSYRGEMSSITGVLQRFSIEVTDQLRLKLSQPLKERLKRQYAVGSEPYQKYLKGRFYLNQRTTDGFQDAIRYFSEAIAEDPDYAPAYSGLANTYAVMATFGSAYGGAIPAYALEQARIAAGRALDLDSTLAEAYTARAGVEMQADYNWDGAGQDFRRAIELDPNGPDAHEGYALNLCALGRSEEALREIKTAQDLAPSSLGLKLAQLLILRMARRYDESLALIQSLPKSDVARGLVADYIAYDYWAKFMPAEALAAVKSMPAGFTAHGRIPLLVAAYARAGQIDKARELLGSYVIEPDKAWWYYLALAHLSLNDTNAAVEDLEHAHEQRYEEVIWLGVDPLVDSLRGNSQFRALLRSINLLPG